MKTKSKSIFTNATIEVTDGSPSDTVVVTIPKNGAPTLFARLKVVQRHHDRMRGSHETRPRASASGDHQLSHPKPPAVFPTHQENP